MGKDILDLIYEQNVTPSLLSKKGSFVIDENAGITLLYAAIFSKKPANYALISSNQYSAQRHYEFLLNFFSEDEVVFFPSEELLRAESYTSNHELMAQRIYAMYQLVKPGNKILVTHPSALLRYLPSKEDFKNSIINLKVGDSVDLIQLKAKLVDIGYKGNSKVENSLQFASRGDILDIYSVSYLDPIRIEFFGDEIESIRFIDISTQQSKQAVKEVDILPATDIFLTQSQLEGFKERARAQLEKDSNYFNVELQRKLHNNVEDLIDNFEAHNYKSEMYKYFGFALNEAHSILSYFDSNLTYVCRKESFDNSISLLETESREYFRSLYLDGKVLSKVRQYMDVADAIRRIDNPVYGEEFITRSDQVVFQTHSISAAGKNLNTIIPTLQSYLNMNDKVVLCLSDPHQKRTLLDMLKEARIEFEDVNRLELPEGKLGISTEVLSTGFEIPSLKIVYISSNELFGNKRVTSRFTSRFKEATILKSYEELKPGDYVVHETNGIGQFLDIKTIEIDGIHRDFLHLAYANNEFLYVPLEQFRLVRKYAGREGAIPKLSRLSSGEWTKRKERINQRINDLADRLLALYGERARGKGYAFPLDDDLMRQFESEFPHSLTVDQQKSLDQIKADMESDEVMDRLLCGDVGFGKTEVAFRAAFKAICGGKQVAMLAPTTLLARQHYEVALDRFSSFGVRIAVFSRLIPAATQKQNIELIANGQIDLVIGTHRLLSKEIVFKDLGLLIVDEEQRFGVEQKERIKELKSSIDVLTLSATPIPRTLQMSLVGVRDFSSIGTAPLNRMPIQTYVTPFKQDVVDELIQRELARNGQVFYVHNRVQSIYSVAAKIAARIPSASVGVAHGQMDKDEVEEVMERFYDGELNVLVCTSIVENGIDIPNANMIIVEDADTFGLSQLYQIKGRVGRGNRISYAYLMYKERKELNDEAKKRLQAIQEFTELGSGYKIAQRDLMIRGAGDMLGPEQAGFIDSIGLDLYLKMLNEAVLAKKNQGKKEEVRPNKMLSIDAYIPKEYASKSDKISLYQELDEIKEEADLNRFKKKIRDIYGRIPEEVELLLKKKKIDILLNFAEFDNLEEETNRVNLYLSKRFSSFNGIGNDLFNELVPYLQNVRVTFVDRVLKLQISKVPNFMDILEKVMIGIHKVYLKYDNEDKVA